ncbi:MAG: aldo/keto reductase [Myxococcales bacterium]|nr:aldo/keto reductase [Myxococcales bacterium]
MERTVRGVSVPALMYGTAWKEDRTRGLVERAIEAGFRAIDTANQRKHYFEAGVGEGVRAAIDRGLVASRDELFLQTKFTFQPGQDQRLPYDPRAPIGDQVRQSFESSLEHLGVARLDSLVLHGPMYQRILADEDWAAWNAMEGLAREGRVGLIGVSNVDASQLEELCAFSKVKPAFCQNRCFARLGWDARVREVCARHDVVYQGFSLLTANGRELHRPEVQAIAERLGRTMPEVVFAFAHALGILPLTGTSDPEHMRQDLSAVETVLDEADLEILARP